MNSWILFEELLIDRFNHEVQGRANADQACHGIHRIVVDEGRRIECARRHDGHQFRNCQGLCLDQRLRLTQIGSENLVKPAGVNFAQ